MSSSKSKLNILVAPLDWGLGHTTRCIPIIHCLIKNNVEVILAGNKTQQKVLTTEFPTCKFLHLDGYNIRYNAKKSGFVIKMAKQIPSIISSIKKEHKWLQQIIKENNIDGIISDNRFGLYAKNIPSVFITHQLLIKTPFGKLAESLLQKINYNRIKNFAHCWIPDFKDENNLAGDLSHPQKMPLISCTYVGSLCRLQKIEIENKKQNILFIISGPEPQRSIFEKTIFKEIEKYKGAVTVVRGLPTETQVPTCGRAVIYNHLSKDEINIALSNAAYVICRSGYTSVMDVNAVGAKAIFVPTPGQTEQEYLANYLTKNKFALSFEQKKINLVYMLQQAAEFSFTRFILPQPNLLQNAVEVFLQQCNTQKNAAPQNIKH